MVERPAAARRILLITNNLPPVRGGSGIVYDNLARHAGGRIIVMAPKRSYENGLPLIGWREHDRLAPYRVIRLESLRAVPEDAGSGQTRSRRSWLRDAAARARLMAVLARCVLREGVVAVCVGEPAAGAWILDVLRLFPSVTRAVYMRGADLAMNGDDGTAREHRRALGVAHRVIVDNPSAAAGILDDAAKERVLPIGNGVDATRLHALPRPPELVALYGLADCFVFLTVRATPDRDAPERDVLDRTIGAFARVAARYPDCRLLVMGDAPCPAAPKTNGTEGVAREDLAETGIARGTSARKGPADDGVAMDAIAADQGVTGKILFTGPLAPHELNPHHALGDVFVLPGRARANGGAEELDRMVLEAGARGQPVIADGDAGTVRHGVNGLRVDDASLGALAESMLTLRRDADLRERLRAGGRAMAEAADWRHGARSFLALFDAAPVPEPRRTA